MEIGTVIRVHGFIMLSKMPEGFYKLVSKDPFSYTFARGKNGTKPYVRHYSSHINGSIGCFDRGDNNGIEIIIEK